MVSEYIRYPRGSNAGEPLNSETLSLTKLFSQRMRLTTLLMTSQSRFCSRHHDVIHGILGLCDAETQARVPVDYYLDWGELWKVTLYIIESSKSLDVLLWNSGKHICTCHESAGQLPKLLCWVPDWRCQCSGVDSKLVGDQHTASGPKKPSFIVCSFEATLTCTGLLLGSVESLQPPYQDYERSPRLIAKAILGFFLTAMDGLEVPNQNEEKLLKVFSAMHKVLIDAQEIFEPYTPEKAFIAFFRYFSHLSTYSKPLEAFARDMDPTTAWYEITGCPLFTQLFTTRLLPNDPAETAGVLGPLELGNCNSFCREGDLIAILYGCGKPIALRNDLNAPGRFRIVGPVYLPSFSKGEALGKFKERDFIYLQALRD